MVSVMALKHHPQIFDPLTQVAGAAAAAIGTSISVLG
jgi:hypothetical protein